jgi:hypothetical protein
MDPFVPISRVVEGPRDPNVAFPPPKVWKAYLTTAKTAPTGLLGKLRLDPYRDVARGPLIDFGRSG